MRSGTGKLLGGVGELLTTAGALVLLFVFWQLVWTDVSAATTQRSTLQQGWSAEPAGGSLSGGRDGTPAPEPGTFPAGEDPVSPPVMDEPAESEPFAVVHVPRFGSGWAVVAAQGMGREDVLNDGVLGHYPGTAMPGAIGNTSFAGHRTTYGKPLEQIQELVAGDPVVVETADAGYLHRVTGTEIVTPDRVDVIGPVPGVPGAEPTRRMITLTACHPKYSAELRYIVHGELESWQPRASGAPAVLGTPAASAPAA